jgi:hypothetical protein
MSQVLTSNGRFDRRAIWQAIRAAYARHLPFINGYTGDARAFWQAQCLKQVTGEVWRDARYERAVWIEININIRYTAAERARLAEIDAAFNPLTAPLIGGRYSPAYYDAKIEAEQIRTRAHLRGIDALLRRAA